MGLRVKVLSCHILNITFHHWYYSLHRQQAVIQPSKSLSKALITLAFLSHTVSAERSIMASITTPLSMTSGLANEDVVYPVTTRKTGDKHCIVQGKHCYQSGVPVHRWDKIAPSMANIDAFFIASRS